MKPAIKPGCLCLVKNLSRRGPFTCPPNAGDIVTAVRYLGTRRGITPQGYRYVTEGAWEITNQEIENYLKHSGTVMVGVSAACLIPISDPDSINSGELWDKLPNEPEQVVSDIRKALSKPASKV